MQIVVEEEKGHVVGSKLGANYRYRSRLVGIEIMVVTMGFVRVK